MADPAPATTADDDPAVPDVELPADAFDALLAAAESLDPDERIRFEGVAVGLDADGVGDAGGAGDTDDTADAESVADPDAASADADAGGRFVVETGEERLTGLDDRDLHEVAADHAPAVTDWYVFEHVVGEFGPRRALLRWLEDADGETVARRYAALADGVVREWGQLRVTVRLTDRGERRYEVRHVDDGDVPRDDLTAHDDPLDAREIVRFDERERYRPLKTAPTLRRGWVFPDLGPTEAYETVETVYPATVANWYREREGDLDVTHWRETMERQSGIYGVVKTWDRGESYHHVNWVAEACCDDSQCLKRREWEYDADTDLDVDGGDGVFPCREPCSLVVSAARKWTRLESEESRTYEFELTPSEKEQVEAVIDAVADGRTDEIREADVKDDANRYRTRFLRAKRFDDDGALCGVPTDPEDGA